MTHQEFRTKASAGWSLMLLLCDWPAWAAKLYVELQFDEQYAGVLQDSSKFD